MAVRLVRADPEPMEIVAVAIRDGAIGMAYVNRPDLTILL